MAMYRIPSMLGEQGTPASGSAWLNNQSISNMHWKPGPVSIAGYTFDPLEVLSDIKNSSWSAVKKAVETLLGPQAFSLGAVYGAGESIVVSVVDLLGLMKTLVLADVADSAFRQADTPLWKRALDLAKPGGITREIAGMVGGQLFKNELEAAQADRNVLIASLRFAMQNPSEVLGGIGQTYVDKWK
jgi:hypothetical protein